MWTCIITETVADELQLVVVDCETDMILRLWMECYSPRSPYSVLHGKSNPRLNDLDSSVMQELLDRTDNTSLSQEGSSDRAMPQ